MSSVSKNKIYTFRSTHRRHQTIFFMKAKEIRDLLEHIVQSGLAEVEIETDDFRISVRREHDRVMVTQPAASVPAPSSTPPPPQPAPAEPIAESAPKAEPPAAPAAKEEDLLEVRSPMIGTFYRAANPESPPFVEVGQRIEKGTAVCIVEAMKLFNEIESEVSGTIVKVLVENATPVEYDQVLFLVKPD